MLALREFFWGWGAAPPGSATATAVAVTSAGGGGKLKLYPFEPEPALENLEHFWQVREEYLKRVHEAVEKELPHEIVSDRLSRISPASPAGESFATIVADRERAYRAAQAAQTESELRKHAEVIVKLTLQLVQITSIQQLDDDVILMLLLTE